MCKGARGPQQNCRGATRLHEPPGAALRSAPGVCSHAFSPFLSTTIHRMCGRYTLVNLAQLTDLFPWITETPGEVVPRYNIAPSQPILAVANERPDQFTHFLWGLIPSWAKDPKIGAQMCNARAETLAAKNSFKNAYRRRRCLIPADGFYEWKLQGDGKTKQPM